MKHLFLLFPLLLFAACLNNPEPGYDDTVREDASPDTERPGFASYGTMMGMDDDQVLLTADAVVANASDYDDTTVRVEGTIAKVCQMKGCWVTLQSESGAGGNLRIEVPRDADGAYVYTFPKDLGPVRMVVEGTVEVREEDPEAIAHYEADGAEATMTDEDGSRRQVVLVATSAMVEAGDGEMNAAPVGTTGIETAADEA